MVLIIIPGLIFLLAHVGSKLSNVKLKTREIFLSYTGSLLPFSLLLWMAFVIPMLFVNITFVIQSASDPFGWGWDFFGTANTPWHQLLPRYIPWIQALQQFWLSLPFALFLILVTTALLLFFTN
jgi:hypothetical protein